MDCNSQPIPTEATPLLQNNHGFPYHNSQHRTHGFPADSPDETFSDGELQGPEEINENDFDIMLSKSNSYTSAIGLTPESQENSMLRGPRSYSKSLSRVTSHSSQLGDDLDSMYGRDSPFIGVSVAQFWIIFACILANYWIACFDSTIMASSHPVITSYFHSSNSASWLSTAFLLTSTAFQPIFGRISDAVGRRSPFLLALFLFLVGTVWCALAQSMTSFILARAFCGLAAGGATTMCSIITSDLVPIEIRGSYQSYMNITYGLGAAMGAACGGWIADSLGWRWEFGIQVPVLFVLFVVACLTTPKDLGMGKGQVRKSFKEALRIFDHKGSLLLTTSVAFLILGLNLGGNIYPWEHPFIITSLVIFAVGCPLFLLVESRVAMPIMPLHLVTQYPRAGLVFSNFISSIIINSILFNIPLYFQAVLLESATSSGLRLIIPNLSASVMGVSTGFIITYTRRLFWPLGLGALFSLMGTISLVLFLNRGLPDWTYLLFLVPTSMGQGFQFPGTFMAILAVSEKDEMAVVTGTLILWRSLGAVIGIAISSLVVQNGLITYLDMFVTGPEKNDIIVSVRRSVAAIAELDAVHKEQVIEAYAAALRVTFVLDVALAIVMALVILPIKLPRLGKRSLSP